MTVCAGMGLALPPKSTLPSVASKGLVMSRSRLLLLLVLLVAPAASAQDQDQAEDEYGGYEESYEEEQKKKERNLTLGPLERTNRFSLQAGWKYTPNTTFFDKYYSRSENRGLTRVNGTIGGPLVAGTFAYSPLEWLEVGFDLFFTYERMTLAERPPLNTLSFGLLLGVRAQKWFKLGNNELIPFVGALGGPMFAASYFPGGRSVENYANALGLTAGATLRISPQWGVCFEYRLMLGKGQAERYGVYEAGGNWFTVGVTYILPRIKERPLIRNF
jgi:hypothetical protein